MIQRLRLAFHVPLLLVLRRCSFAETAERDALRVRALNPSRREVTVVPRSERERSRLMLEILTGSPEARSVLYHRLNSGTTAEQLVRMLLQRIYPGQAGVEIHCKNIGPGFALGHGQASVIWAERIGQDCTIYQHVTLGLSDGDPDSFPILGDRVWVWPGAKVIGANLGDDCTVAAAALVLKDVPAGKTAIGIPARLV